MADIDKRYRAASGLAERRFYSIFYSRIDPSDGLVLGINPGGNPEQWNESRLASKSFYENWEHEYVDCRYAIQEPMLPFLMEAFHTDKNGVRRIPKTNLAFRRSNGVDAFRVYHGMSITEGQREAQPFVEEIIAYVAPKVIILEGMTLLETFSKRYCTRGSASDIDEPMYTLYRGRRARIFHAQHMHVSCLATSLPVVAIGHPSSFGIKPEFLAATERVRQIIEK